MTGRHMQCSVLARRAPGCLLVLLTVALAACTPPPTYQDDPAGMSLAARMASTPAAGFARALAPRELRFPADHGPHPDYATEWWYFTGNLRDPQGARFGYQLTLFRVGLEPGPPPGDSAWRAHQLYMGHVAISDIDARRHHAAGRFERAAMGLAGAQAQPLRVWVGPWSIEGSEPGPFPITLRAADRSIGMSLYVERGQRPMVLQGERGFSRKGPGPGDASYYYSYTRLPTHGELRIGERRWQVTGDSWLDREWSSSALAEDQAGWDWFAIQLDDGRDLMFYRMRGNDGRAQSFSRGIVLDAQGQLTDLALDDVDLQALREWQSPDGIRYPVAWRLRVPTAGLDLRIEAAFDDQEMRQAVRYWEGAVEVSGSHRGVGYLELAGYAN